MGKFIDLTGQKFSRLTVIGEAGRTKDGRATWHCVCDCGNERQVDGKLLRNGNTKSCGCYNRERSARQLTTHGRCSRKLPRRDRLYEIWCGMTERCYNPNHKSFNNYGGRGICICEEWKKRYEAFEKWALENGYCDNLTIDRIDNDKYYSPDNCRWATNKEQQNNKRNNVLVNYNGARYTMAQLAATTGINYRTLLYRRRKGWSDDLIAQPVNSPKRGERS